MRSLDDATPEEWTEASRKARGLDTPPQQVYSKNREKVDIVTQEDLDALFADGSFTSPEGHDTYEEYLAAREKIQPLSANMRNSVEALVDGIGIDLDAPLSEEGSHYKDRAIQPINDILDERGTTYGKFIDNATVAQELKERIITTPNWRIAEYDQQEALHMICSKISRLTVGDINHIDSWRDIAGYATLIADRLEGVE